MIHDRNRSIGYQPLFPPRPIAIVGRQVETVEIFQFQRRLFPDEGVESDSETPVMQMAERMAPDAVRMSSAPAAFANAVYKGDNNSIVGNRRTLWSEETSADLQSAVRVTSRVSTPMIGRLFRPDLLPVN